MLGVSDLILCPPRLESSCRCWVSYYHQVVCSTYIFLQEELVHAIWLSLRVWRWSIIFIWPCNSGTTTISVSSNIHLAVATFPKSRRDKLNYPHPIQHDELEFSGIQCGKLDGLIQSFKDHFLASNSWFQFGQGETQARAMKWMQYYAVVLYACTDRTIELYEHMIDEMEN